MAELGFQRRGDTKAYIELSIKTSRVIQAKAYIEPPQNYLDLTKKKEIHTKKTQSLNRPDNLTQSNKKEYRYLQNRVFNYIF